MTEWTQPNRLLYNLSEPGFSGLVDFQDYGYDVFMCHSKDNDRLLDRDFGGPDANPGNLKILKILVQTKKNPIQTDV